MKCFFLWSLCFLLTFFLSDVHAQLPTPATSATNTIQVGVAAAVKGTVEILNEKQIGKAIESGEPIFMGNEIRTGEKGQLQIMLLDETVFTIGPKSVMVIDEFIYDPKTANGKINARVVEGAFRLITGKIGEKKPENLSIQLPVGSMGIRGTIVYGKVEGNTSTLLLLGPGANNNTQDKTGAIIVENETENGKTESTEINKSGYSTTIPGEGQAPTPPVLLSDAQTQEMMDSLGGSGEDSDDGDDEASANGESENDASSQTPVPGSRGRSSNNRNAVKVDSKSSASDTAGQSTAGANDVAIDLNDLGEFGDDLGDDILDSIQDSLDDEGFDGFFDGLTKIDDLDRAVGDDLLQGKSKFQSSGHILNKTGDPNNTGTFDFYIVIDFDNREIGGSGSELTATHSDINASIQQKYVLDDGSGNGVAWESASVDGDFAGFAFDNIFDTTSGGCSGCTADVTIDLNNQDGNVADFAEIGVDINDGLYDYSGDGSVDRAEII